ncbi:hypothetical protein Hte_003225 [Hypoxylon texense]
MSTSRQRKPTLRRPSKCYRKGYSDADGDVDMGLPSPSPSITGEASPSPFSETAESSPLNIRVTSSRKNPLFPNAATHLEQREKDSDEIPNEKRNYKFDSFAKMIDAHVEELKERPLRGISKDYGDGTSRGEMMDIDDDVTMEVQQ